MSKEHFFGAECDCMVPGFPEKPRPRKTHELKTWPEFFHATRCGRKKFELRRNDRDYQVGDELHLQEWNPAEGRKPGGNGVAYGYTGRELLVRVDYIMTHKDAAKIDRGFLFEDGDSDYVIMSISHVH